MQFKEPLYEKYDRYRKYGNPMDYKYIKKSVVNFKQAVKPVKLHLI